MIARVDPADCIAEDTAQLLDTARRLVGSSDDLELKVITAAICAVLQSRFDEVRKSQQIERLPEVVDSCISACGDAIGTIMAGAVGGHIAVLGQDAHNRVTTLFVGAYVNAMFRSARKRLDA